MPARSRRIYPTVVHLVERNRQRVEEGVVVFNRAEVDGQVGVANHVGVGDVRDDGVNAAGAYRQRTRVGV